VLGTDCSGVREWLGDNRFGIVVQNSTDGIYQGLKQILHMDPGEQTLWIDRAAEKASEISFQESMSRWQNAMMRNPAPGGLTHD
jgi:glycosyltransferase involved in cell wall biosynthesis